VGFKLPNIFVFSNILKFIFFGLIGLVVLVPLLFLWYSHDLPTPGKLVVSRYKDATRIYDRKGKLLFWERGKDLDFIGLTHNGYLEQGVRHCRCFLIQRSQPYVVVMDFLSARSEEHRYEWTLNSPMQDFKISRGRAVSPALWVGASDPDRIEAVQRAKVRMCLPMEGRSTWGVPRGEGTNLRFVRRGGSLDFHHLLMPQKRSSEVHFAVAKTDTRSRHRLGIEVETARFKHRYTLDCQSGELQQT